MDLYGLISFIDPRIFGSEQVFRQRYMKDEDYDGLKRELTPVLYRTLRKDVADYMHFVKRICRTVDFELSPDEIELYERVNLFLKRDALYSIPASNRGLIILVIRKLMASSSFALVETFEVLKKRLEKLYEGTRSLMRRRDSTCSGALSRTRLMNPALRKPRTRTLPRRRHTSRRKWTRSIPSLMLQSV